MSLYWSISPEYLIPIIALGVLILGRDLYLKVGGSKILRWVSWLILLAALYGVLVPPVYQTKSSTYSVILADSGFAVPDSIRISDAKIFSSFHAFSEIKNQYAFDTLLVFSRGLADWQLASIDQPFGFVPIPIPEGIIAVTSASAYTNAPFELTGELSIIEEMELQVILPDGASQSKKLAPENPFCSFELTVNTPGNSLIELIGTRNDDTLFKETFPIHVAPPPTRKVLLLTGFPTFESRYLVEYLDELNYEIISYQQLTRISTEVASLTESNLKNSNYRVI